MEYRLLFLDVWFKGLEARQPVVKEVLLGCTKPLADLVAGLLELNAVLLLLPVSAKNGGDLVLVKLELLAQVVHPHELVHDVREIAHFV